MLVSILTVAYNGERTIARAMESVLNQTYNQVEYIVVDGDSTDRTVEIARSFQQRFDEREGYSLTIVSEKDRGMYDALNKGVRMARGELVGNVNTDDYYEPEAVQTMADLYAEERYDVAWGSIVIHKASGNMVKKAHVGKLWTTAGFCHPAMFARKEVLLEFPYALLDIDDDFDFATRVHLAGKRNRQGRNPDGVYGNPANKADRRIITTNKVISNYNFGGMSTSKNIKASIRRIKMKYTCYRRHHMCPLYWFYCVAMEAAKYILA